MNAIAKPRNWQTVTLGFQGIPYPTVQPDGTVVLDAGYVPLISSSRTPEQVNGVAFRDMPAPEHLPYFLNLLDAINKKGRRVFTFLSDPGIGKSYMADVVSNMMIGDKALRYECGDKRLGDLLFTTDLTERPEQTLYDRVLERVRENKIHPLSLARLKKVIGEAFDSEKATVDWEKVLSTGGKTAAIDRVFKSVAKAEGINQQSNIALREDNGLIIQAYEQDRIALADEYNKGKPGSDTALQTTLQWLAREGQPFITVQSSSGRSYELDGLDGKPGFFVILTGNATTDGIGTFELSQSQYSRLQPSYLPNLGKLGLTHRFCQIMTGLPLSTLDKLYGPHFEKDPAGFVAFCKGLRTLGLSPQEAEKIPAHQMAFLNHPMEVIAAADKCAEFFLRWQNKTNLSSANLPANLMAELSEDYVKANSPDPRLFIMLFNRALERAERRAAKDQIVKPGGGFNPVSSDGLTALTDATSRIGSALMELIAEEVKNKTPQQPNLRGILMTDAAELGLLPATRQGRGNVKTLSQLLKGNMTAAEPANQNEVAQPDNHQGRLNPIANVNTDNILLEKGKLIPGRGIYLGPWELKDRHGRSIGKQLHVFSALEDLTNSSGNKVLLTFKNAAEEVGKLRNWHSHDGIYLENDAALYKALADGSAIGKWFIPPRDLLDGKDADGNVVQADNLYDHRNMGVFAGTFTTTIPSSGCADWYWSCTEHRDNPGGVWFVSFTDGHYVWIFKDDRRLSCRPCRVELAL